MPALQKAFKTLVSIIFQFLAMRLTVLLYHAICHCDPQLKPNRHRQLNNGQLLCKQWLK